MIVRVWHKAPVVRDGGTIILENCVGRFGWNLQGKTARSALYLTVKVAGGGTSVHAFAELNKLESHRGLSKSLGHQHWVFTCIPSRKIKIRHFIRSDPVLVYDPAKG
jgi:hypothetical protein